MKMFSNRSLVSGIDVITHLEVTMMHDLRGVLDPGGGWPLIPR